MFMYLLDDYYYITCARSSRRPVVLQLQSSRMHSANTHFGCTSNRVHNHTATAARHPYPFQYYRRYNIIIALVVKSVLLSLSMCTVSTLCRQNCNGFAPAAVTHGRRTHIVACACTVIIRL